MTDEIVKICKKHGELTLKDLYEKTKKCRKCCREYFKKSYYKNRENILKRQSVYTLNYRKEHPEKVKIYNTNYWKKSKEEINDNYVKDTLLRNSFLNKSEISKELIELQRSIILLKRKIKEIADE